MNTHIVFNDREFDRVFLSPEGPVGVELGAAAIRVESAAKINASGRPGPNVRTGRLRSSIQWGYGVDEHGLYADVGTNVPYGEYLETGNTRNGARYPFLQPALAAAHQL